MFHHIVAYYIILVRIITFLSNNHYDTAISFHEEIIQGIAG